MEPILFIDHVGFNVVGEKVDECEKYIRVKNPAVLQASPNQQNQLQVQLLPVLFKEFLDTSKRDNGITFAYPKDKVVVSDATLESRLKQQYIQMFSSIVIPSSSKEPEVVKLFDE